MQENINRSDIFVSKIQKGVYTIKSCFIFNIKSKKGLYYKKLFRKRKIRKNLRVQVQNFDTYAKVLELASVKKRK